MQYRPEIDGLRSLAVIPVMLFHAGFAAFSGGFVGVDVFFVISGYLITKIIIDDLDAGTFSLLKFYERRVRRILPALFFMMAIITPVAWLMFMPKDLAIFARSLIAVPIFSSNILFWRESGYFDTAAELKPLLHTWSLAVEEQYYVLFPILMMLSWTSRRRRLLAVLLIAFLFSITVGYWGAYHKPAAAFYLLPARGWELLIGAFAALYLSRYSSSAFNASVCKTLSLLGMALLFYAVFSFDQQTPYPGLYALVPTLGTVLVIIFSTEGTFVNRVLGSPALVGMGLISYSAYLWHQPLLAFARYATAEPPSSWLMGLMCVLTLPLAYASWRFVEKPVRHSTSLGRPKIFAAASAFGMGFIALGLAGYFTGGFEKTYVEYRLSPLERNSYLLIKHHTNYDLYDHMFDDGKCVFWSRHPTEAFLKRFEACSRISGKALVIVGDSHAMNIYNIAAKSKLSPFIVGVSQGECRPQDNRVDCHYDAFVSFLEKNTTNVAHVLFHQSGSYFIEDKHGIVDSSLAFVQGQTYRFNEMYIDSTLHYVSRLNSLVPTYWLGPFVEARVNLSRRDMLGRDALFINPRSLQLFSQLDDAIKEQVARNPMFPVRHYLPFSGVKIISPEFLKVGECITYRDIDHFSLCGEDLLAPDFGVFFSRSIGQKTVTSQ